VTKNPIGWTEQTWNPVTGCTKCAPGCLHCYAERMAKRLKAMGVPKYANGFDLTLHPECLGEPLHWRKPRMIFIPSMGDLFHPDVPDDFIDRVFAVMSLCPQHTFQVLTKRSDRRRKFLGWADHLEVWNRNSPYAWGFGKDYPVVGFNLPREEAPDDGGEYAMLMRHGGSLTWPLENVWQGSSISTQADADREIPFLLQTPAAVRFVSLEPLLEAVQLGAVRIFPDVAHGWANPLDGARPRPPYYTVPAVRGLDWVIIGSERIGNRPGRPCNVEWVKNIWLQCQAAGVPCWIKQITVGGQIVKAPAAIAAALGIADVASVRGRPERSDHE